MNEPLKSVEMSLDTFPRTLAVLKSGVEEGVSPGFVAGLWSAKNPDVMQTWAVGNRRLVPSLLPMLPDTVFDLASLTKVFGTATLAAVLVEKGWIRWDLPVQAVLPEFRFGNITVAHLLSHTAGYTAWEPYWERLRKHFDGHGLETVSVALRQEEMRRLVFATDPLNSPEETAVYSDISFLMLGFLLERVLGETLDTAVKRWVWNPMGLRTASFRRVSESVVQGVDESIAATEDCPWRKGVLQGQVHDDNCWAMGGYAGHAGAFGAVGDVLEFARSLLGGFLSSATRAAAWTRVLRPEGCERTLGWDTPSGKNPSCGMLFSSATVGHLGFTGTSLWIDPQEELAVVLLSNRVHPTRDNIKIRKLRPAFHDAVRLDLIR